MNERIQENGNKEIDELQLNNFKLLKCVMNWVR